MLSQLSISHSPSLYLNWFFLVCQDFQIKSYSSSDEFCIIMTPTSNNLKGSLLYLHSLFHPMIANHFVNLTQAFLSKTSVIGHMKGDVYRQELCGWVRRCTVCVRGSSSSNLKSIVRFCAALARQEFKRALGSNRSCHLQTDRTVAIL